MVIIIFFCLLQGFTEFLPVSSQGHLIVFDKFYPINLASGFSVHEATILAHFGSLLAVVVFYKKEIIGFFKSLRLLDRPDIDKNAFMVVNLFISTIPIIIIGYFFARIFNYESTDILIVISVTSIIFAPILFLVDSFCLRIKNQNSLKYSISLLIGIFQCFALVPGVSRSGSILTIMRFLGFQRKFAVYYSNLLSIPVIFAATSYLIINNINNITFNLILSINGLSILFFSFIFSIFFIFFLVSWVKKFSLFIFAFYRLIFGILLVYFFIY